MHPEGSGLPGVQLMDEAGQGLVALHQRGIVHRDIKPQNILLLSSHSVFLLGTAPEAQSSHAIGAHLGCSY